MSKKKKNVTFIENPSGFNLVDVSDAQNSDEELILDEIRAEEEVPSKDELDDQLSRLSKTMAEEEKKQVAEFTDVVENPKSKKRKADSQKEELERQIAEDEAIEEENRRMEAEARDPEVLAALPKADENGNLDLVELQSCIETLLF